MISRLLRAGLRRGRSVPVVGSLVRAVDRRWWARSILASGLVDPDFYAAQRGLASTSARAAVKHYVRRGWRHGLSVNPLFDELVAGRGLPEADRVPAMYAYVIGGNKAEISVHPFWDARAYAQATPDAATDPRGPLGYLWGRRETATLLLSAGALEVQMEVGAYASQMTAFARQWGAPAGQSASSAHLGTIDASFVGMLQRETATYDRALHSFAELAASGIQVIVPAVDLTIGQWLGARLFAVLAPGSEIIQFGAADTYAHVTNTAMGRVAGTKVLVVDPRVAMSASDAHRCLAQVRSGSAISPLAVQANGTIEAIGAILRGATAPYRILHDHPLEDAFGTNSADQTVPALTGRTFGIMSGEFREAGGLDESLVDDLELEALSVRLRQLHAAFEFRVLISVVAWQLESARAFARVDTRRNGRQFADIVQQSSSLNPAQVEIDAIFTRFGFEVAEWRQLNGTESPLLRRCGERSTGQRWAIKICAPAGPAGKVWGDTHFATGLASALRRLDFDVVVDSFDARARPTFYLDDVTVVVRGPYRIDPPQTGVRILWIISHPDQITADELAQFDFVFAASERWASKATTQFGREVLPLLECTDTDLFYPRGLSRGSDIVFVGTARGIARPAVVGPLEAGIAVKVYGPDWRGFIPAEAIAATSIANERLSERYETASIVLNDQWPAMRREGFMAMRLFDAVAAGGRVVSERVDGVPELFGGAAIAFDSTDHLVSVLRQDPSELFPSELALAAASAHVRAVHSFDARAGELVRVMTGGEGHCTEGEQVS